MDLIKGFLFNKNDFKGSLFILQIHYSSEMLLLFVNPIEVTNSNKYTK